MLRGGKSKASSPIRTRRGSMAILPLALEAYSVPARDYQDHCFERHSLGAILPAGNANLAFFGNALKNDSKS